MKDKKIVSLILVIVWMVFIFVMSSYDGSESSSQSNLIVNFIINIFNINNIAIVSIIIRKIAHFTEYLILGILVCNMMKCYNKEYYLSIIVCIIYAISDEIHQIFVPDRSCQVYDMMIDSLGSIVGILLIDKFIKFKQNKKIKNKG